MGNLELLLTSVPKGDLYLSPRTLPPTLEIASVFFKGGMGLLRNFWNVCCNVKEGHEMCPRMSCFSFPVHPRLVWAPHWSAEVPGVMCDLCRTRSREPGSLVVQGQGPEWGLAMQSRGPLWAWCGVSGIEGRVRDLPQALGAILVPLHLRFAWEGLSRGPGTTRNLGSVSTPRRGGSYQPGRGCGNRRRLQPVSAREELLLV